MNNLRETLIEIAKRYIETEKACCAHPLAYSSCPPQGHDWEEYRVLSAEWQEAESDLWRATDVEYDDKDALRAACWEWRYAKVMARQCTWHILKDGDTKWARNTMWKLHNAEAHLMELLGLSDLYKSPCQRIEEAFPRLKYVS